MILLFTDFGIEGPYVGQMEAQVRIYAPGMDVIHLLHNAPIGDPVRSAYLLAALCQLFPERSVFLAVVDPGVGGSRRTVVLDADGRWFVGPENGLFNTVAVQAEKIRWREIEWRPERLSTSFHGRDLFAPVAARIAAGDFGGLGALWCGPDLDDWPADLSEVIYFDHYGNAITGLRYSKALDGKVLMLNGREFLQAETFCAVPEGQGFWYGNSMGLVEIAVNRGRAESVFGLRLGMRICLESLASTT